MSQQLHELRDQINELDERIAELLEKRFEAVELVKQLKQKNSLPLQDSQREKQILERTSRPEIKEIFRCILNQSLKSMQHD